MGEVLFVCKCFDIIGSESNFEFNSRYWGYGELVGWVDKWDGDVVGVVGGGYF